MESFNYLMIALLILPFQPLQACFGNSGKGMPMRVKVRNEEIPECLMAGWFRNPNDCRKFYRCVDVYGTGQNMVSYPFDCPANLVFDEDLSVCNHPSELKNNCVISGSKLSAKVCLESKTKGYCNDHGDWMARWCGDICKVVEQDSCDTPSGCISMEIGNYINFEELNLRSNKLTKIPKEIGNLKNLKTIYLQLNDLETLPKELGNLENLKSLYVYMNRLISLPKELGNLQNLETLSLEGNQLTEIPKEFGNLKKLRFLNLEHNRLTTIPKELGNLENLEELKLHGNQLTEIPEEIGKLKKLTKFTIEGNTKIPQSVEKIFTEDLGLIKKKKKYYGDEDNYYYEFTKQSLIVGERSGF